MTLTDREVAVAAARAGADVVRARYRSDLVRHDKGDDDFATDVDVAAERAIAEVLRTERPADRIRGEELGRHGGEDATREWLVDPLCGTRNYAAGTPGVAVNVALVVDGSVTVAAVADPLAGDLLWSDTTGAFSGADRPLRPAGTTRLVDLNLDRLIPRGSGFHVRELLDEPTFVSGFRPRVSSTSLALAWVATGQRAGYVTDGDVAASVHFAAAVHLCQRAGCVVSDLRGGPVAGGRGLVAAADSPMHRALLAALANVRSPLT